MLDRGSTTAGRLAIVLSTVGVLGACEPEPVPSKPPPPVLDVDPAIASGVTQVQQGLWVDSSSIWSSSDIGVCFEETPGQNFTQQRGWIRDIIRDTWEAESSVTFRGWGNCGLSFGIRIILTDGNPVAHCSSPLDQGCVNALGKFIVGEPNNMAMNATCGRACVERIAVHEFGHALGFAHEHGRSDKAPDCTAVDGTTMGDIFVGAWDKNSVMSACKTTDGRSLTATDIEGVQMFYGAPHAITTTTGLKGHGSQEAYMSWSTFGFMNTEGQWEGVSGGDMMGGSVAAASWERGRLDVMYRIFDTDPAKDGAVRHRWSFPGWASGSEQMAAQGTLTRGTPQMFSPGQGKLQVFGRLAGSGVPYRQFFNGVWGFDNIGFGVAARGELGLAKFDETTTAAFWRDENNRLRWVKVGHDSMAPGTSPAELPGSADVTSSPAAIGSWISPGRVDVFARGVNNNLIQWFCINDSLNCVGPIDLGGIILGNPAVVSLTPGTIHLFVRGSDGGLWMKTHNGQQWIPSATGWRQLSNANTFIGSPTVVALGNQIAVWAQGPEQHLLKGVYYADPALDYFTGFWDRGNPSMSGLDLPMPVLLNSDCSAFGCQFNSTAGKWMYAFEDANDYLRVLYFGVHNHAATGTRSCNSPVRQALAKQRSPELRHAWRYKDADSGDFVAQVGVPPQFAIANSYKPGTAQQSNPFCNAGEVSSSSPSVKGIHLGFDESDSPVAGPNWNTRKGDSDFADLDPIRVPCEITDEVCQADGTTGLVQVVFPPAALSNAHNYPVDDCDPGSVDLEINGGPYTGYFGSCGDGSPALVGGCIIGYKTCTGGTPCHRPDGSLQTTGRSYHCTQRSYPGQQGFCWIGAPQDGTECRGANNWVRNVDGTIATESSLGVTRQIFHAFHRNNMSPQAPTGACKSSDAGTQLACFLNDHRTTGPE